MNFKNIEAWLRVYKTLPANDLENFGKYIRQDSKLLTEFNKLLCNLSSSESSEIVDPVFHQLFNFYRSNIMQLKYFSIELLPRIMDTYLIYYYTAPEHLSACIGAFLLGIYNLTATGNVSRISKEALSLNNPSIYHDPPPISINKLTNNNNSLNNYNTSFNNKTDHNPNVPFKKFDSINAYNRSEIMSYVLGVYNWHICLMSQDSQKSLCNLCSRLCMLGLEDAMKTPSAILKTDNSNTKSQDNNNNHNNDNDNNNFNKTKNSNNNNSNNCNKVSDDGHQSNALHKNGNKHNKTTSDSKPPAHPTTNLLHQPTEQPTDQPTCNGSPSNSPSNPPNHPPSHNHSSSHSSIYSSLHSFDYVSIPPSIHSSIHLISNLNLSVIDESITEQVKIPFTAPLFLELLKGIYFLIFNGLSYLALSSLEHCHLRASYEMNAPVLLVTNAILNSVKQVASTSSRKQGARHYHHLIPLSPCLSLPSSISLSKDAITSASFKTKKLPEDIEVQEGSGNIQLCQFEQRMIKASSSTSDNLDFSTAPTHEVTPSSDSDKNPFSRIQIISMIKNKEKSFRQLQQRSREASKEAGKEGKDGTKDGGGGDISSLFSGLTQKRVSLSTKSTSDHSMLPFKFTQQNTDSKAEADTTKAEDSEDGKPHPPDVAFKSRFIKSLHRNFDKSRFHSSKISNNLPNSNNNNLPNNNDVINNNKTDNDDVSNGYVISDWSKERMKYDWSMEEEDDEEDEDKNENEDGDDNDYQETIKL